MKVNFLVSLRSLVLLFIVCPFSAPVLSVADQLCVRNRVPVRNNSLRLSSYIKRFDGECPARFRAIPDPTPLPTATPAPTPAPQTTVSVFGSVDTGGNVLSSGGDALTHFSAIRTAVGIYDVTVSGDFPTLSTGGAVEDTEKLNIVASVSGLLRHGVSWFPLEASRSQLRIRFLTWDGNTGVLTDPNLGFSLAIYIE